MNCFTTRIIYLTALVWLSLLTQPTIATEPFTVDDAGGNSTSFMPPPSCVLLQNPEFDASLTNWTILGNSSSTTDAYAGTHAARISGFYSAISQNQTAISAGNIYTLTGYGKITGAPWWAIIGIRFLDSGSNIIGDTYVQVNSANYEEYKVTATAPSTATSIETYALVFGFGELYADEFCLEETVPVIGSCFLLQNEGFENDFTNWSTSGSMNIVTDANSGTQAAELRGNGSYFYQRLGINSGQTYQLQGYAKVTNNAPSYAELFIDWRDASNNLISSVLHPVASTVTSYTLFTLKGKAPPGAAYAVVGAYKTGSSSRRLLADDFCFSIIDPLGGNNHDLSCGCTDNLLPNGGLEENNVNSYPYNLEGVTVAAIADNNDWFIEPFDADLSSDYMFYVDDYNDIVNNPEGDHFIWFGDNNDEIDFNVHFTDNLLLEDGETYVLCFHAAAWTASLNSNDLPDGGTEAQQAGIVTLEIDYVNGGVEDVFHWAVPESDSFNDMSWTKLSYTFTYNENDPIEDFAIKNDRNNTGIAIDAISLGKVSCNQEKDCGVNGLNYQKWNGISSYDLKELLMNPDYPNNYDESGLITNYQGPINIGDSHGSRVFGYIVPSITGNYTFNVTGDDDTRFYLSTDSSFINKSLVAYVDGWTNVSEHNKYGSQTSSSIYLVAGEKYYTELLHKEGWGGDHYQVYWRTPTNSSWNIIPSANLEPICFVEICNNGKDDDFDGLVDCFDDECSGQMVTSFTVVDENCGSGEGEIDLTPGSMDAPLSFQWSDMPITAHWTFEGTTDDVSGNLNHARYTSGSLSYSNDAIEGTNSAYFNGFTRIRYSIDNGFMETSFSALSVSLWVKPDNLIGTKTLFDEGGSTGGRGMAIRLNNNLLSAGVRNGGGGTLVRDESHIFPSDGQWHHIAAVFDNGEFTVYLDGIPSPTQTAAYTTINNHGNNGGVGGNFGGSVLNTGSTRYRGYMDDVRYHLNIGLTPGQVADLARNDGDRSELFAGTYDVTITTSSGCTVTQSMTVNSSSNHTDGGSINGNESSCDPNFDPTLISSISPASGGGAGTTEYQWQESTDNGNTWLDIAGENSETLDPSTITQTTLYRRGGRLFPCLAWVYSDTITKSITTNYQDAGVISGDEVNAGPFDPSLINDDTGASGGNGGSLEYQWQESTDTLVWNNISGANGAALDPVAISQTTFYRRGARRTPCVDFVYTSFVLKEVVINFTDGGLIAGQQDNCGSFDPTIISSVTTPSGGTGGTLEYQWQESTDSLNWTDIAGANTETLNPTTVIQTMYYRRGARRLPWTTYIYSNAIKIEVVSNYTSGGVITGDQSVCGGYNPFAITNIAGPTGGSDGMLIYQWQESTDGGITWSDISGAAAESFDPDSISQTTYFRRQARRNPCAAWINSNYVLKEVRVEPIAAMINYPVEVNGFICEWVNYTFEADDLGAGTTYFWNFGPLAIPNNATGRGPHTITFNVPATADSTTVTTELTVFSGGCSDITTMAFEVRPQIVVSNVATVNPDNCSSSNGEIDISVIRPSGTLVQGQC